MSGATAFARQVEVFTGQVRGLGRETMIRESYRARDEAQRINTAALGRPAKVETIVDGRAGAQVESVRERGGVVVFLFAVGAATLQQAVDDAAALFAELAPVKTGRYQRSLVLLVNSVQVDAGDINAPVQIADTDFVTLTNLQPYSRKLERGWSHQAPNGVLEVVASMLRSRYRAVLKIAFAYENFPGFAAGRGRTPARYPVIQMSVK